MAYNIFLFTKRGLSIMIKLILTLTYSLTAQPVIVTLEHTSLTECLKMRQEKVTVLDEMNAESIILGYSAVCQK